MDRRCFLTSLAATAVCRASAQRPALQEAGPFTPSEGLNNPIGEGKGIHPGRVVWMRDANATSWDGKTGYWWDDANTDQRVVNNMVSRTLLELTGQRNEKQAWDALFRCRASDQQP